MPMQEEEKQFAKAPESSAAWMTVVCVGFAVTSSLNETLFVDLTWSALPFFRMDLGDLVDMLDRDDVDEPMALSTVDGALFQLCVFGPLSFPIPSFLMSCKRGSSSDFSLNRAPVLVLLCCLKACSLGALGWTPSGTSPQLLQLGGCGRCCRVDLSNQ